MMPESLRMTGAQLRAWREKLDLSQVQLGQLARTTITKKPRPSGGFDLQANTVQRWEDGSRAISAAVAELISVKLYLLETDQAIFEDLIDMSLADVLKDMGR
jgi:transcriptional regulator with XRE-family HTH domain